LLFGYDTKIDDLTKHLRENYFLRCLIKNQFKPIFLHTQKKNKAELTIHGDVILKDISLFFKEYNIDADFMNLKGHLLPHNILLKDVEKYYPPKKETNEVIKSLKIISSMTDTNMYDDMDWIIRIYKRIINIASTEKEKSRILNSIIKLNNANERFTDRDSKQLIDSIKKY